MQSTTEANLRNAILDASAYLHQLEAANEALSGTGDKNEALRALWEAGPIALRLADHLRADAGLGQSAMPVYTIDLSVLPTKLVNLRAPPSAPRDTQAVGESKAALQAAIANVRQLHGLLSAELSVVQTRAVGAPPVKR